jgi:predicted nucleotidyltransferase
MQHFSSSERFQSLHTQIRAFGVKRLGVIGSFVREPQDGESDVHILVEFEPGRKTFDNFIHLDFFLEDLFNTSC